MFTTFHKSGYRTDLRVWQNLTKVTHCSLSLTQLHTKDPTMSSCGPATCLVPLVPSGVTPTFMGRAFR